MNVSVRAENLANPGPGRRRRHWATKSFTDAFTLIRSNSTQILTFGLLNSIGLRGCWGGRVEYGTRPNFHWQWWQTAQRVPGSWNWMATWCSRGPQIGMGAGANFAKAKLFHFPYCCYTTGVRRPLWMRTIWQKVQTGQVRAVAAEQPEDFKVLENLYRLNPTRGLNLIQYNGIN